MDLVFVHGWGFHGGIWREVVPRLGRYRQGLVDLGFLRDGPRGIGGWPENAVYVGHSFGVLWLLKHGPRQMRGLISIAGFDCFHANGPVDALAAMKEGLNKDPRAQLHAFWRACGLRTPLEPHVPDPATLRAGLDWLATWDARAERQALACPVLALASQDDAIVPEALSRAVWRPEELRLRPTGGHALPLTEPDWCAEQIAGFVDALDA